MLGILHVHSENSLKKCALLIDDICQKAKDIGYEALALTDNGNMTGIAEFIEKSKKYGIKPVPGVEMYIGTKSGIFSLVLLAKDYIGYIGICKAVSEANRTLVDGKPVLPENRLSEFFGKGNACYGHVYATSAGTSGILSYIACADISRREELEKYETDLKNMKKDFVSTESLEQDASEAEKEITSLRCQKKSISARTGKNFCKKEEALKKLSGTDGYQAAWEELEQEKNDCLLAERELESVNRKISRRKKKLDSIKKKISEEKEKTLKRQEIEEKIVGLKCNGSSDGEILNKLKGKIEEYKNIFGENFYIELMFHGLETEAVSMPLIAEAAQNTGTGTVLSNDVHILNRNDEDVLKWHLIQSLEDNKWQDGTEFDQEYYMKDEETLEDTFRGLISDEIIEKSADNLHAIFDSCSFEWPGEKHYPKYHDPDGLSADDALERKARDGIKKLFKDGGWTSEYEERLKYELSVIKKSGYSDYTLIISEILEEGRKGPHDGKIGYYIGPGRGSGAGSIVNYLTGITHIDPLKYNLIFERYLNIERISPPDIDSDIATSIRDLLVRYITKKYSENEEKTGVCSIVTKSRLTAKDAIRAAGRIVSSKMYGNAAKLYSVADKISKSLPTGPNIKLADYKEDLDKFDDDTEKEIVEYARMIEGVMSNYGTHAAGIIISDSGDVTDYAPVMNVGTNEEPIWNIQFDKEESERIGLLKLDALGLTTLDIITKTLQRIYDTRSIEIDIDHIPFEKQVFRGIYGSGKTMGVFQCKSSGMRKLWQQMQPDSIEDIIAGIALYRPGPMDFIPDYIKGKQDRSKIEYIVPELEPILRNTYGVIVYQEQVMQIVRDLAGYSMGRSDLVRRAMSKKKQSIMDAERKNFVYGNKEEGIPGCIAKGIPAESAEKIYDRMIDFARYAFNKSHAAAYALVSYQSAWLKFHYPKEFLIEAMNFEEMNNIPVFIEECRKYGFEVCAPDINLSSVLFTEYNGKIIYGLGNVKGVKKVAGEIIAERDAPFYSLQDFMLRTSTGSGAAKALIKGGAFDSFCNSRKWLLIVYENLAPKVTQYKKIQNRISEKEEKIRSGSFRNEKEKARCETGLAADRKKAESLLDEINHVRMDTGKKDDTKWRLEAEKEALSAYVSMHPLDEYRDSLNWSTPISTIDEPGYVKIAGVISRLSCFKTKKGQDMAVFDLDDGTATIKVLCWPKKFEKYGTLLAEGAVLKVYGDCKSDRENREEFDIHLTYAGPIESKAPQTIIMAKNMNEWENTILPQMKDSICVHGSRLILYLSDTGELIPMDVFVNEMLAKQAIPFTKVRQYLSGLTTKEGGILNG